MPEIYRDPLSLNPSDLQHQTPGILANLARQPLFGNSHIAGVTTTGKKKSFIADRFMTLRKMRMVVNDTGDAGDTIPDVNINGVTALAAAGVTALTVNNAAADGTSVVTSEMDPANQLVAPGDVVTIDIDTAPTDGADVDVQVYADVHI